MKTKLTLAFTGTIFILYYITLKIIEGGSFVSFSLIWLVFGCGLWTAIFLQKLIFNFIKKTLFAGRTSRIATISLISVFLAISGGFLVYICIPGSSACDTQETPEYLIVLGGGIRKNGEPSTTLRTRLDMAILYLEKHPEIKVIVSGGQGKNAPWPEAQTMANYIKGKSNIKNLKIIEENGSLDTIQNMKNSRIIILEENVSEEKPTELLPRVCILTSDSHLNRSIFLAKRAGFTKITGIASPTPALFIPTNYTREIASYWKLWIRILLEKINKDD